MTDTPYRDRFEQWLEAKKKEGLVSFKPTFNKEAIAEHFGAKVIYDDFGMVEYLDFSETEYKTIQHPEVMEYIYKGLLEFATAPSYRLRNETDKWGNVVDKRHFEYMSTEDKISHVLLCRRMDGNTGISSRWEYEMVIEGHLPPTNGRTVADYEALWEDHKRNYEERSERPWPHPRPDDHDGYEADH